MKKYISCILLAAITLFTFCACSEREQDNTDDSDDALTLSKIEVTFYDEDWTKLITIIDYWRNDITLSVNACYYFKVDRVASGATGFSDEGLSFDYDDEYIAIEKYDTENVTSHKYYFTGLQTSESTILTVSFSSSDSIPLNINITLTE